MAVVCHASAGTTHASVSLARGRLGGRPPGFGAQAYKGRNVMERCINRINNFSVVAICFDKHGCNCLSGVILASFLTWFG
jgi:hypothetical protein